jgi:GT2 family glycosyltransferase
VLADPVSVSVVVPVVNRPELLRLVLADLAAQSYPDFTVIVVDNAPATSGARGVVDDFDGTTIRLEYLEQPVRGGSPARNRGLAASRSEITAFVDADVRIDTNWLVALVAPMASDPTIGGSAGLILPSELETRAQRWMEEWGGFGKGFEPRVVDALHREHEGPLFPYAASLGSGTSMAFRTAELRKVGGFDVALGPATPAKGGEDLAALLDVLMAGNRLAYAPDAIVWHPHPRREDEFLAKLHDYGIGLTAHLTRALLRRPASVLEVGLRLPAAAAYLNAPASARNSGRRAGFPTRRVRRAELSGMATGPFAYLLGVVRAALWRTRARRANLQR